MSRKNVLFPDSDDEGDGEFKDYEEEYDNDIKFEATYNMVMNTMNRNMILYNNELIFGKLNAIIKNVNTNIPNALLANDIENLFTYADKNIKKLNYLSLIGIVLGYYVTNGGKEINRELLDSVIENINNFDEKIQAPDVIRYSRLWQ